MSNSNLENLCPFAATCSESNFGDEEICESDYETCTKYKRFKKEEALRYINNIK